MNKLINIPCSPLLRTVSMASNLIHVWFVVISSKVQPDASFYLLGNGTHLAHAKKGDYLK